MRIFIKAKIKAKKEGIEKIDKNHFIVFVREVPEKGKANRAILKSLANYFNIPTSRILIISGNKSSNKIIDIN